MLLKFILRKLWIDRVYSLIKILGLAIGMAAALLAILYVRYENGFDRFHANASRLYRITTINNDPQNGGSQIMGATGQVEGPAFKDKIPEIEEDVRIWAGLGGNMIANGKALSINYLYADTGFFDVFSFPLMTGTASGALLRPNSMVITERTARRFFGKTDVVGQTIQLEEGHGLADFIISGVAKNLPDQSSIQFEAVLPFSYLRTMFADQNWLNSYLSTFVLLRSNSNIGKIETEFGKVFREAAGDQLRNSHMEPGQIQFGLQPIADIHLNIFPAGPSPVVGSGNLNESSSLTYSYILTGIATLILIMAVINFLNLSMAESLKRSKEIAVRKISGGSRRQIAQQFLTEASILCILSYVLAMGLLMTALPLFNQLSQRHIRLSFPGDLVFLMYGLLVIICCVLFIGLYPAIRLSMFDPTEILFQRLKIGAGNLFNKGLTVVQFTLAICLLIATIIYYRQMNFVSRADLGYDPSNVVEVYVPQHRGVNKTTEEAIRNRLNADPSILQSSYGEVIPMGGDGVAEAGGHKITTLTTWIDRYFLPVSGISLVEGRNFSSDFGTDSLDAVIVNETFAVQTGLKHPVGERVDFVDDNGGSRPRTIVGVVKDFHYHSLREKIQPVALMLKESAFIWVKIKQGNNAKALATVESTFRSFFPNYFHEYSFLSDTIRSQYEDEQRWKQIISYAAGLAMIICCVGLMALAHFETVRRTKEIAIRKVLGSSVANIALLLSKVFVRLLVLSLLIATPVSFYIMNRWLENFSYRIHLSWVDFAVSAMAVLMIALITVNARAFRAATANPLPGLRTE